MSLAGWVIVGLVVFIIVDFVIYAHWIKRARAARNRGEPAPPLRWWL